MNSNEKACGGGGGSVSAAGYRPQVGDTVRSEQWRYFEQTVKVTAVGQEHFLAVDDDGGEAVFPLDRPWVKVEPTPADRYIVFRGDTPYTHTHRTAEQAKADASDDPAERVARFSFAGWVDAEGEL